MKGLALKAICLFIIAMYCFAPLSAADLNADHNNIKIISHGTDGSDIQVKDVNITKDKTGDQKKNTDDEKEKQTKRTDDAQSNYIKVNDTEKLNKDQNKANPKLRIDVKNSNGNDALAEIKARSDFSGYVSVYLKGDNNIPQKVFVKDGYGKTIFKDLASGNYTATVKFIGSDRFSSSQDSTSFNIGKEDPALRINVPYVKAYNPVTAEISGKKSFSGNVTVYVKGDNIAQKVFVKDGYAKVSLGVLPPGEHEATVKFIGDKKFAPSEVSTSFNVGKCDPALRINVKNVKFGENATAEISAKTAFSGNVTVYVKGDNNIPQKVYVKDGVGECTFSGLSAGKHVAVAKFIGDDEFTPGVSSITFNVEKCDPALRIHVNDVNVGENATAEISAKSSFTGNVNVYMKGNLIPQKVYVKDGVGECTFSGLSAGKHLATVKFIGDENYAPGVSSTSFNVNKIDSNFSIKVNNITEGQKAVAVITANETLNGQANVELNNSNAIYPVTIVNGSASVTISDLAPGDYLATVRYHGDNKFNGDEKSVSFNVKKAPKLDPKLKIKVNNINYGSQATVSISTDSAFSGKVGVDIGSKHIDVKVANGKGTAKVSGLKVGTYTAKAIFKETDKYKSSTKSTKFTVKKVNVKLGAKSKTFKHAVKIKKFAVSLKNNKGQAMKGKKIILKVNGKTYAAKTNSKGVAIFKINKLSKVGKYKAVISFAGDKIYNKASKAVNICLI